MSISRFPLVLFVLALLSAPALANDGEPAGQFASPFTDNAVLQRGAAAQIWGSGSPGDDVRVELGDAAAEAVIDANGKWSASLQLGGAQRGADLRLLVRGRLVAIKRNVMIGDVYLCSGQSNMQWPVEKALKPWVNLPAINDPDLRLLHVAVRHSAEPQSALAEGEYWRSASPEAARGFSAICYYFGQALREKNPQLPVGLISAARGGSKARAWLSEEGLRALGGYEEAMALNALFARDPDAAKARYASLEGELPFQSKEPWITSSGTGVHYNAMVAPLAPYTVRAAAWYQGESDTGDPDEYQRLLPALMEDWRRQFRNPDMPWFIIQLSSLGDPAPEPRSSGFLKIRQVQADVALADRKAALIHTIDIGDPFDVHPTNKQEVARRLLLSAERLVYGNRAVGCDPRAITAQAQGGYIYANLPEACAIEAVNEAAGPLGFQSCDRAGNCSFVHADLLDPRRIRIAPAAADSIAEIRYCWAPSPYCNSYLANAEPLPPFTAKVAK